MAIFTAIGTAIGAAGITAAAAFTLGVQVVLTVASIGYQMYQANKMRKGAQAAAEARKGKEIVTEGILTSLPLVYGRAKIGGARVWANTSNNVKALNSLNAQWYTTNAGEFLNQEVFITSNTITKTFNTSTIFTFPEDTSNWYEYTLQLETATYPNEFSGPILNYVDIYRYVSDTNETLPASGYRVNTVNIPNGGTTISIGTIEAYYKDESFNWNGWQTITGKVRVILKKRNLVGIKGKTGSNNEFLFLQQAMCIGPINSIKELIFDDTHFINDKDISGGKRGIRINGFYGDQNTADNFVYEHFPDRKNSVFTNAAYLSGVIQYDRDDPQFSDIPAIQAFIEGRKVLPITSTTTIGGSRVYSNNPAEVLLDYLLDSDFGAGLSLSEIDLESFYASKLTCNQTVKTNVPVAGSIWEPTTGGGVSLRSTVPLYECNIILDTEEAVRDNVNKILQTMGDARLVWIQGKYRLVMQYATSNAALNVSVVLTDEDLLLDDSIVIGLPSSKERLNHATVTFANEALNFKEDTVSWPFKEAGTLTSGSGGKFYPEASGWEDNTVGGRFLNTYGVWEKDTSAASNQTKTMTWKFVVPTTRSDYVLQYTSDNVTNSLSLVVDSNNATVFTGTSNNWRNVFSSGSLTLTAGVVYRLSMLSSDSGGLAGAGARIYSPVTNEEVWNTRRQGFSSFITQTKSNTVYNQYLSEDNGVLLEDSFYYDGCTDFYHALAKAEETVRISRTSTKFKFKYLIKNRFLTPGDYIRLSSEYLGIGFSENPSDYVYIRVDEVNILDENVAELSGARFDYTQLAWNVDDNEILIANPVFTKQKAGPRDIYFVYRQNTQANTQGTLYWEGVSKNDFSHYTVQMYRVGDNISLPDGSTLQNFITLGATDTEVFDIPYRPGYTEVIFRVWAAYNQDVWKYGDSAITSLEVPEAFKPKINIEVEIHEV
jgi:hypothetical protein